MQIFVNDPVSQTIIFAVIFFAAVFFSVRKSKDDGVFPVSLTNELKGAAILMVIFAHIGYLLSTDNRFIFPLSILGGVGVNLFLFLSGYGLAMSAFKKKLSPLKFYWKRVLKIFIPLWIIIAGLVLIDKFWLGISWPWQDVLKYVCGFFPTNNAFADFNSPLWFITLIIFYYLIFPFLFWTKKPKLSALVIFIAGLIVANINLPVSVGIAFFYKLHIIALPLGILFASFMRRPYFFENDSDNGFVGWLDSINNPAVKRALGLFRIKSATEKFLQHVKSRPLVWRIVAVTILAVVVGYLSIHSGVGDGAVIEQLISIITVIAIVLLFITKKIQFRLLTLVGIFSYEIYLIHWPVFYRYGFLYNALPPWLGTLAYIAIIFVISWLINLVVLKINSALQEAVK